MPTTERVTQRGSDGYARPKGADWQLERALRLELVGMSETGPVRPANEDAFLLADVAPPEGHGRATGDAVPFVGIADGVGGHAGGARASRLACGRRPRGRAARSPAEWAADGPPPRSVAGGVVRACQARSSVAGRRTASSDGDLAAGLIRGRPRVAHVGTRCTPPGSDLAN
jgi:hypothetical protein